MTYRVTRHHGGGVVLSGFEGDGPAIEFAKAEAKRTGARHDVHDLDGRVVACFPNAMLWERDLVDLPGSERVRRYQAAALVGVV